MNVVDLVESPRYAHRLEPQPRPDVDVAALVRLLEETVNGEVRFNVQSRALYATDASNYRLVPLGVVLPKTIEAVEKTVAACRRFGAPITSRGGGTSLAGQTCNVGVIIDFSKYLNRILELNPDEQYAWVEPGCVLDDLRSAAEEHYLTFGPDPSTHDHNTLGGMCGNNSCGVHSVMAGRTTENVIAMEILTYDGERMIVGETSEEDWQAIIDEGGRRGGIYADLRTLRDEHADRIRKRYPDIPRRVSGYNLDDLLPENGPNIAKALVGSEGTCVTLLRMKCRLVPSPKERVMVVLGYPDVCSAGDAVPEILKLEPIGLEGIDDKLVKYMRMEHMHVKDLTELPEGGGWLLVEFGDDTQDKAAQQAKALMDRLKDGDGAPSMKLLTGKDEQAHLWEVRKAGLGATANIPTMPRTHTGWEDAAVPPAKVGPYLRDFRKLIDDFGYDCSIYGHFGDGCIHCRIDFDFVDQSGVDHFMHFLDKASDLVLSYGGSLSGEHGDGQARAAFLDKMYGSDLVEAFRRFKHIWDPDWKMNPNKVVDPFAPDQHLREGPAHLPWSPETRMNFGEDDGDFANVTARCVGVGECRKHDHGDMCPSYMATREEAYSTRGRARLLFEMTEGSVINDGWRSKAVHDALDLCLACKACKSECPVHVDMASYKAEFMHHHYKGRLRPRVAYSMGLIWWWSRAASTMPGLVNWATQGPLSGLAKAIGGFAPERSIPRFASPDFRQWFAQRSRTGRARKDGDPVVLWPDTFNTYFTPKPLMAAVEVLERAGYRVVLPEKPLCCGRPLYSFGFLGEADRLWQRNIEALKPAIRDAVPIVGLEPTCVAAFKDELLRMRPHDRDAQRLSRQVRHFSEFLAEEAAAYEPPKRSGGAVYHAHCHHRAVLKTEPEIDLLKRTGLDVDVLDDGCCGMAGDYGFRKETYGISMTLGERAFLPAVREAGEKIVVSDAFSCREQAFQATGRMPLTLPELLNGG